MIKKLRIQRILIESTVENKPVWIHVTGQEVHYDDEGNQTSVIPSSYYAHFTLASKATEMYSFFDPITKTEESHSGAGIATAVTQSALMVLQEKYGGIIKDDFLCL